MRLSFQNFKCSTFADFDSRILSWRGTSELVAMIGQTAFEEIHAMRTEYCKSTF